VFLKEVNKLFDLDEKSYMGIDAIFQASGVVFKK
jgi:hypothetical protein